MKLQSLFQKKRRDEIRQAIKDNRLYKIFNPLRGWPDGIDMRSCVKLEIRSFDQKSAMNRANSELFRAIMEDNPRETLEAIKNGADINARIFHTPGTLVEGNTVLAESRTALGFAILAGKDKLAKLLQEHGAVE